MADNIYDIIIIGGGPAGLSAAIYAARYKLKTIVFSKTMGGLAATAHRICNYPSYSEIKGFELMQRYTQHTEGLGVEIIYEEITKIEKKDKFFIIYTENEKYKSKKLIYSGGTTRTRLNVPGEGKFLGNGVSYCTTCDAAFFKDKVTVVVGGGDAALTSALLLVEYTDKVYIIYRQDRFFKGDPTWIELVNKNKKIKSLFKEEVIEIMGDKCVEKIKLKSGKEMKTDGLFIEVGSVADTKLLEPLKVELDSKGYIITDKDQKTNIAGLFAAGDITNNKLKQIITASSEGSVAAYSAYKEISEEKSSK
jgi:thioredoxin reductase (NADPH)